MTRQRGRGLWSTRLCGSSCLGIAHISSARVLRAEHRFGPFRVGLERLFLMVSNIASAIEFNVHERFACVCANSYVFEAALPCGSGRDCVHNRNAFWDVDRISPDLWGYRRCVFFFNDFLRVLSRGGIKEDLVLNAVEPNQRTRWCMFDENPATIACGLQRRPTC